MGRPTPRPAPPGPDRRVPAPDHGPPGSPGADRDRALDGAAAGGPIIAASRLPPLEERVRFVEESLAFARASRGLAVFRFLKLFTRADEEWLLLLIAKIHAESHPHNYGIRESPATSLLAAFAHPWQYLASKTIFWRRGRAALFDLETTDKSYFERRYERIYAALPGPKRITAVDPASFAGSAEEVAPPISGAVSPRSLALLFLWPLLAPQLLLLSLRLGRNILAYYRRTLGLYATFDAHFRRFPCRNFITFSDEQNHPARHLAFRQNCAGKLFVVQNGSRTHHPAYAFGSLDAYLAFGPHMEPLARELGMKVGKVVALGSLNLDERHAMLAELDARGEPPRWDVLFLDQTIWPYNQFDPETGRSQHSLFRCLGRLKERRPELRVAYQLRHYGADAAQKAAVLAALGRALPPGVALLENEGRGESYRAIHASRLVLTMQSTLGHEAFWVGGGRKVLFVNMAGNPHELYMDDERFQFYSDGEDCDGLAERVSELLALELPEPPSEARARHLPPDGLLQERMARAILVEAAR